MALTRKLLESLGLEADKVATIIEAHAETVDALKEQISTFKDDASKLADVQKELDTTKSELEALKGNDWQKKYEKEHQDFEAFKTNQTQKETKLAKEQAYRALLKETGVSEKRIDSVIKVTDLSNIVVEDGKVKDADKLKDGIKTEWADFITSNETEGAGTNFPPKNDNHNTDYEGMSIEEYIEARSKENN